jgi:NAD(P)H-nitrite reductase large subunit
MAGVRTEYPGGTAMNSLNYFGLDIASAGTASPLEGDSYELINKQENGVYQRLVLKDDLIVGMVCVGAIEKAGILFSLMRDKVKVSGFKKMLLSDNFGLVSLPKELRQKRLEKEITIIGGLKR